MALDSRILLQNTTPDLMSAISRGVSAGQAIRQAPLVEALKRQQIAQAKQQQAQQAALAPLQQQILQQNLAQSKFDVENAPNLLAIKEAQSNIDQRKLEERQLEREQRQLQFESKAGELKPGVQKILDTSQTEAVESAARARQLGFLADDLLSFGDIGGGKGAKFSEFLKTQLGTQDDVTELRRRYNAIRSSEAVQNLPPGVASDKDIELALKGFPREDAPKEQLVSFLRGSQKLAQFRADFNRVKSQFISKTGSTRGLLDEISKIEPPAVEQQQEEEPIGAAQPSVSPASSSGQFDESLLEFMSPEERALFNGS